jgi:hypothetical protein
MKRIVSGLMVVVFTITMIAGCNQSPLAVNADLKQTTTNSDNEAQRAWILDDGSAKQSLLNTNMTSPKVAAFVDTLASWGYSYRPQNSMVMIATFFDEASSADAPALQKNRADSTKGNKWADQDTVIWQVFENAAFDSSKHTAVVTGCRGGKMASIFVEIDVSNDSLNLIRGWVLGDSSSVSPEQFSGIWGDYGKCVTLCCAAAAVLCILSGHGWIACWTTGCLTCYASCALRSIFTAIIDILSRK